MPGGVIEVGRRVRSAWIARLDPLPLLGAWRITARRVRDPAAGAAAASSESARADGGLGWPALLADERGEPRCVACGLCAFACPADCLHVTPGAHPRDPASRRPERFELEAGRCLSCGLCEEACPERAIALRHADRPPAWSDLLASLVPDARADAPPDLAAPSVGDAAPSVAGMPR